MGYRHRRRRLDRLLSVCLIGAVASLLSTGCTLGGGLHSRSYTVTRGDTLYAIAQRHDMNWHELARWNHIGPPYRIEVGQQLLLTPPGATPTYRYAGNNPPAAPGSRRARVARAPQDTRAEQRAAIQASTPQLERTIEHEHRQSRPASDSAAAARAPTEASRVAPARPSPPAPATPPPAPPDSRQAGIEAASKQTPSKPTQTGGPSEDGWQWPASGSILRGYTPRRTSQGIDIGGQKGAPVYAASSGRVVYTGSALKGYGQLIIIKHDEHFLSAYGFTQRPRVAKGEDIAAGTQIAAMGLGPQNKPMLHFEIRRDGSPIDPASVLPAH